MKNQNYNILHSFSNIYSAETIAIRIIIFYLDDMIKSQH